jgi:hypothetical protein
VIHAFRAIIGKALAQSLSECQPETNAFRLIRQPSFPRSLSVSQNRMLVQPARKASSPTVRERSLGKRLEPMGICRGLRLLLLVDLCRVPIPIDHGIRFFAKT